MNQSRPDSDKDANASRPTGKPDRPQRSDQPLKQMNEETDGDEKPDGGTGRKPEK